MPLIGIAPISLERWLRELQPPSPSTFLLGSTSHPIFAAKEKKFAQQQLTSKIPLQFLPSIAVRLLPHLTFLASVADHLFQKIARDRAVRLTPASTGEELPGEHSSRQLPHQRLSRRLAVEAPENLALEYAGEVELAKRHGSTSCSVKKISSKQTMGHAYDYRDIRSP